MGLNFKDLASNYPSSNSNFGGCGNHPYKCAIKMSVALRKNGVNLDSYQSHTCEIDGKKYARGAQDLLNHLINKGVLSRSPSFSKSSKEGILHSIQGKTGLIFFENIIGSHNDAVDHIDLWDKDHLVNELAVFETSKKYLFWEIK